MNGPHDRRLLICLPALAFGAALGVDFAPASAQPLPWVGVSGAGAERFYEAGFAPVGPAAGDSFGFALAAGDFDHDGADDLAIGVPFDDCLGLAANCGAVDVRFGLAGTGLTSSSLRLSQQAKGSPDPAAAEDFYGRALAVGDFDGDGHDDLAVGVPGNRGPELGLRGGSVQLHAGHVGGLTAGWYFFTEGENGLPDVSYGDEAFGSAVTFGDFNGDGRDDLAVGAPLAVTAACNGTSACFSGSVMVIDRSAAGAIGAYTMRLGDQGLPDQPEDHERFGAVLAAGDFNCDGYDDLAIGVPEEDAVGAVLVVYGSPWSLLFANHVYIGQYELGDDPGVDDRFGAALAAGDFDRDGCDDLAVGAPYEDGWNGSPADMGLVTVLYGAAGLDFDRTRTGWLWESSLYGAGSEDGDRFGWALAAGDFDGDGRDDLAIGTPGESNSVVASGAVSIALGTDAGLAGARRHARPGAYPAGMIPDTEFGSPSYGWALAAGDFDGNGFADLAAGAPFARAPGGSAVLEDAGAVAVLYGQLFRDDFETGSASAWSVAVP